MNNENTPASGSIPASPEPEEVRQATSKHTPGPWHRGSECSDIIVAEDSVYGFPVADLLSPRCADSNRCITQAERKANADLISATPELLEACRIMRREWGAFGKVSQETLNQVESAISKAEGRSAVERTAPIEAATQPEAKL